MIQWIVGYTPFVSPLPIWRGWAFTLIPLCVAVAIVYKAMKLETMSQMPRQAFLIALWIVGGMCAAAVVLAIIVSMS